MYGSKKKALSDLEKRFVKEAEEGHFDVDFEDDGTPCAYGAKDVGNLFTIPVTEVGFPCEEEERSIYRIEK